MLSSIKLRLKIFMTFTVKPRINRIKYWITNPSVTLFGYTLFLAHLWNENKERYDKTIGLELPTKDEYRTFYFITRRPEKEFNYQCGCGYDCCACMQSYGRRINSFIVGATVYPNI